MTRFFRRLPISVKLLLTGLVPLICIIYLTENFYHEKQIKVGILKGYIEHIHQLRNISALVESMQEESKHSYDVVVRDSDSTNLAKQRKKTDSIAQRFFKTSTEFAHTSLAYSNLLKLNDTRKLIDNKKATANSVISYYSNTVFWLNTLISVSLPKNNPMEPVFDDLRAQKLIADIITYLSLIRTNIYNVLYSRKDENNILLGSVGAFEVYKSYNTEFISKAPPGAVKSYDSIRKYTEFKPTIEYLDRLFANMRFDSTYTADEWWEIADKGLKRLSELHNSIWNRAIQISNTIYRNEEKNKNRALILLLVVIAMVASLMTYSIYSITEMLRELKLKAEKISKGITGSTFPEFPNDAIGSLADSIAKIDRNYQQLATAADAIGKKNFEVEVVPRSEEDILANALIQMKNELKQFTLEMEQLVAARTEELKQSNESLENFAHVASHDLKEPLRKISTFTSRLQQESITLLPETSKLYLEKLQDASERLSTMVQGILEYSGVNPDWEERQQVDLNKIISGITEDLELLIAEKTATISFINLPVVTGISVLLHQLFYNLISNSLKFSKPERPVKVEIKSGVLPKHEVTAHLLDPGKTFHRIEIMDNGIGFDPAQSERMFQLFTRLNNRSDYHGTGLGLALCKKIVTRHGGTIYASGVPGKGSTFFVVLPE